MAAAVQRCLTQKTSLSVKKRPVCRRLGVRDRGPPHNMRGGGGLFGVTVSPARPPRPSNRTRCVPTGNRRPTARRFCGLTPLLSPPPPTQAHPSRKRGRTARRGAGGVRAPRLQRRLVAQRHQTAPLPLQANFCFVAELHRCKGSPMWKKGQNLPSNNNNAPPSITMGLWCGHTPK